MKTLRVLLPVLLLLTSLAFATNASALTRYAAPGGSGTTCAIDAPCDLAYAVNTASGTPLDIKLLPGTYGSPASPIVGVGSTGRDDSTISAADPLLRPLVNLGGGGNALDVAQGSLSGFDIVVAENAGTLAGAGVAQMDRMTVRGNASFGTCIAWTISNSVCVNGRDNGAAVFQFLSSSGPISQSATYTNVTAWSTGSGSDGLYLQAGQNATMTLTVHNSIFHGVNSDFNLSNFDTGSSLAGTIRHTNFANTTITGTSTTASANTVNNNQSAPPLFANAAGGDFRELAGSPTVDAGDSAAAIGTADAAGATRIQGSAIDIGALELAPASANPPPPTAPTLTGFKLSKKKYRAAKSGKAFQPAANAKRRANKGFGSTVSFKLSGEGGVHFRIFKQVRKNGKKVWKYVKGVETVTGLPGTNKFWFSGRWAKKTLPAGTYMLKATPTVKGGTIKNTSGDEPGTSKGLSSSIVKK